MELPTVWFILIATLWTGYFFLEGFDFGVGILLPVVGRDEPGRRVVINTIGPVWDGNEVWLLTAGGATFAAFPEWYATLFSGFYLALLLILVALIVRGVAFEYRGKREEPAWRRRWDAAIVFGSAVPAFLWGVAFGNILRGVPIGEGFTFTGGFLDLLNPYALLGGLVTFTLFSTHGAAYLSLKTTGEVRERSHALVPRLGLLAAVLAVAFLAWTLLEAGEAAPWVTGAVAALALLGGLGAARAGRDGWAFVLTGVTIVAATVTLFVVLYPEVLPSSTDPSWSLTVDNASSSAYTLRVMTMVAVIMTPIVLAYQAWTFWVFRRRIGTRDLPPTDAARTARPTD